MSAKAKFYSDKEFDFLQKFLRHVEDEIGRARRNFPGNKNLGYAFTEESGELIKALLDYSNAQEKSSVLGDLVIKRYHSDIYKEAVQTAAMLFRLMLEGSPELEFKGLIKWANSGH